MNQTQGRAHTTGQAQDVDSTVSTMQQLMAGRSSGRIAVVAVLYEQAEAPLSKWLSRFQTQDLSTAYLVFPSSAPDAVAFGAEALRAVALHVGLRWREISTDELYEVQGCLCCQLRSELATLLSQLFMQVLTRREPKVEVVYVLSRATHADGLAKMLKHAPFLAQRYDLAGQIELG